MEQKLREYEENHKLQEKVIGHLQEIVELLKKEKVTLAEEHKNKDEIIHNLKRKEIVCSNGCEK